MCLLFDRVKNETCFEARETIICGDDAIKVASERKRGSDRTKWSMPFWTFVFVRVQIFVHTFCLFEKSCSRKHLFLFGKVNLVLVFGFYFVWEQILSQAVNAHTCFLRKQMRHFFSPLATTYTRACQYNVALNFAHTFVTEHSWNTRWKIKFVIYWEPRQWEAELQHLLVHKWPKMKKKRPIFDR